MRLSVHFLAAAALGCSAGAALAHGPQLQINNEDNKIITREIFLDGDYNPLTDPKSVYVIPLLPTSGIYFSRPNQAELSPGVPEFVSGPGLAYGLGKTFQAGSNFRLSFTDGAKLWNGTEFVDPGSEQFQIYRGSASNPSATATSTDSGPFAGIDFAAISATYNEEAHSSAGIRLLGDGVNPTASSQDGVYLLSLQLSSTQAGLAASDPYYFVLYKNVGVDVALSAAGSLGYDSSRVQAIAAVPEASSLVMVGMASLVLGGLSYRHYRAGAK